MLFTIYIFTLWTSQTKKICWFVIFLHSQSYIWEAQCWELRFSFSGDYYTIYMYEYIHMYHLLFLSSFSLSRTTGAAGMLNHHSLSLLIHLSVLAFLKGEYLVNASKKISKNMYLPGNKARIKAETRRITANFSVAWHINTWSDKTFI